MKPRRSSAGAIFPAGEAVRGFGTAELIALTLSSAVGLAIVLAFRAAVSKLPPVDRFEGGWNRAGLVLLAYPFLEVWTIALSVSCLRTRRASRAARPVGEATCLLGAASVIIIWILACGRLLIAYVTTPVGEAPPILAKSYEAVFVVGPSIVGLVVLIAWLILLASGSWHTSRGWLDSVGRLVGSLWILMLFVTWVFLPLYMLASYFGLLGR